MLSQGPTEKVGKLRFLAFSASCAEHDKTKCLETSSLWSRYIVVGFYFKSIGIQIQNYILNFTLSSQELLQKSSLQRDMPPHQTFLKSILYYIFLIN